MKATRILIWVMLLSGCGKDSTQTENSSTEKADSSVGTKDKSSDGSALELSEVKDASGKITSTGYLLNGKKQGAWVEYADNNLIKTVISFDQDKKEGLYLEFSNSNQVKRRCFYRNDQRHGEYKEFQGIAVKEERTYDNGKPIGVVKIYYDNGKLMEESHYENGLRNGVSKWYDQNGNLSIEYEYKNGELVKK